MLTGYANLIDGVRSYYAREEGDDAFASESASMAVAAIFLANLTAIITWLDLLFNRDLRILK